MRNYTRIKSPDPDNIVIKDDNNIVYTIAEDITAINRNGDSIDLSLKAKVAFFHNIQRQGMQINADEAKRNLIQQIIRFEKHDINIAYIQQGTQPNLETDRISISDDNDINWGLDTPVYDPQEEKYWQEHKTFQT